MLARLEDGKEGLKNSLFPPSDLHSGGLQKDGFNCHGAYTSHKAEKTLNIAISLI